MTDMNGTAVLEKEASTVLRAATPADRPAVEALLLANGLPTAGVPESLAHFTVAERNGRIVGVVGLEVYGETALLRSAVVAPDERGTGVGRRLVERALDEARALGTQDVVLLTTTADRWFPRFGFRRIERSEVPEAVTASEEFRGACPSTAVAMCCSLRERSATGGRGAGDVSGNACCGAGDGHAAPG